MSTNCDKIRQSCFGSPLGMLWDGTVRWAVPALVVPAAEGEKNIARKRGLSMKLFRRGLALLLALSVLGAVTLASAAELPDDLEGLW